MHGCLIILIASYGCNIDDSSTWGYWTSISKNSSNAWNVSRNGNLYDYEISNTSFGVRPVITVSKDIIQ